MSGLTQVSLFLQVAVQMGTPILFGTLGGILCEKSGVLGGLINFTDHTDHKVDIRNFKNLLIRDVEKRPIEVRLNCEVTPELIREIAPEAVVLAVGSDDLILPIEGIENAVTAMDVYSNDFAGLGKSTIVLGGGLVGCEAAADYIDHGVETMIVEMKGALMPETTVCTVQLYMISSTKTAANTK